MKIAWNAIFLGLNGKILAIREKKVAEYEDNKRFGLFFQNSTK
jgi:hypothetical protein